MSSEEVSRLRRSTTRKFNFIEVGTRCEFLTAFRIPIEYIACVVDILNVEHQVNSPTAFVVPPTLKP
jgi:hypothetical protein